MKIKAFIQRQRLCAWMMATALLLLTSCDKLIYDGEGDCSVAFLLKFRYDMNLKWADAFANEVKSVHVYAFDPDGVLVWQKAEKGEALASPDYAMRIDDLPTGNYHLLAWCGLDNEEDNHSFTVPEVTLGTRCMEELKCSLNRKRDEAGNAFSDTRLAFLFHGTLDIDLPVADDGGTFVYTMPLIKDTNHFRIILQHLSGVDLDPDDYVFRIDDENGLMNYDNSLLKDENINYRTWKQQGGVAGIGSGEGIRECTTVIADLTVGRLMVDHDRKMILTISSKDGRTIAQVPLIDYALLAKDYYEEAYAHQMSDQEFLDREDEYVMTFFLDEKYHWLNSYIMILSWRVVLHNVDVQ